MTLGCTLSDKAGVELGAMVGAVVGLPMGRLLGKTLGNTDDMGGALGVLEAPEGRLVGVGSMLRRQHSSGDVQPGFGGKPSQHPQVLKFPFNELGGPQSSFSF